MQDHPSQHHSPAGTAVCVQSHHGHKHRDPEPLRQVPPGQHQPHHCSSCTAGCSWHHGQLMRDTCRPGPPPAQVITSHSSFSWIFYPFFTSGPEWLHRALLKHRPDPPRMWVRREFSTSLRCKQPPLCTHRDKPRTSHNAPKNDTQGWGNSPGTARRGAVASGWTPGTGLKQIFTVQPPASWEKSHLWAEADSTAYSTDSTVPPAPQVRMWSLPCRAVPWLCPRPPNT